MTSCRGTSRATFQRGRHGGRPDPTQIADPTARLPPSAILMAMVGCSRKSPDAYPGGRCGASQTVAYSSEIEHDVAARLRAADQHASVGGGFYGVGVVIHASCDERRLAGLADPGAARPANRYVTRFGELEHAAVVAAPGDRQVAAGELDRRAI